MSEPAWFERYLHAAAPAGGDLRLARLVPLYLVLTVFAAAGTNDGFVSLGLLFFVLPGLLFMAAPLIWLYLPVFGLPYVAWRKTGRVVPALIALAVSLIIPIGFPLTENAGVDAYARAQLTGDFVPADPAPAPTTIAISGEGSDVVSRAILDSGAADHVLVGQVSWPAEVFTPSPGPIRTASLVTAIQAQNCRAFMTTDNRCEPLRPGWVMISQKVDNPRYDVLIATETQHFQDKGFTAFGPLDSGQGFRAGMLRLTIWQCRDACRQLARQTHVAAVKVALPLHLTYHSDEPDEIRPAVATWPSDLGLSVPQILTRVLRMDFSRAAPRDGFVGDVSGGMPALEAAMIPPVQAHQTAPVQVRRRPWCETVPGAVCIHPMSPPGGAQPTATSGRFHIDEQYLKARGFEVVGVTDKAVMVSKAGTNHQVIYSFALPRGLPDQAPAAPR